MNENPFASVIVPYRPLPTLEGPYQPLLRLSAPTALIGLSGDKE